MEVAMVLTIVFSALPMRARRRSIIFSLPELMSCSLPEMVTATAACFQANSAALMTSLGAMLRFSYPSYQMNVPFSAYSNSWAMTLPPLTVRMRPFDFSRCRIAVLSETLSASFLLRFCSVVVMISVHELLGEAIGLFLHLEAGVHLFGDLRFEGILWPIGWGDCSSR